MKNQCTIEGKVGREPFYSEGKLWRVSVVVEHGEQQWTDWFNVTAFHANADALSEQDVGVGDMVRAVGPISLVERGGYWNLQLVPDEFDILSRGNGKVASIKINQNQGEGDE